MFLRYGRVTLGITIPTGETPFIYPLVVAEGCTERTQGVPPKIALLILTSVLKDLAIFRDSRGKPAVVGPSDPMVPMNN